MTSGCKSRSEKPLWGMERAYAHRLLTLVFRSEAGAASASRTACNLLRRGPAAFLLEDGARLMPKKAYPFQLVPVIALATAESDLYFRPSHSNPSFKAVTLWVVFCHCRA